MKNNISKNKKNKKYEKRKFQIELLQTSNSVLETFYSGMVKVLYPNIEAVKQDIDNITKKMFPSFCRSLTSIYSYKPPADLEKISNELFSKWQKDDKIQKKFRKLILDSLIFIIKNGLKINGYYTYSYENFFGLWKDSIFGTDYYIFSSDIDDFVDFFGTKDALEYMLDGILNIPGIPVEKKGENVIVLNKILSHYNKNDLKIKSLRYHAEIEGSMCSKREKEKYIEEQRKDRKIENTLSSYSYKNISTEEAQTLSMIGKKAGEHLFAYPEPDRNYYNYNYNNNYPYPENNFFQYNKNGVTLLNVHLPNDDEIPKIIGKLKNLKFLYISGKCYDIPNYSDEGCEYYLAEYIKKKYEKSKSENKKKMNKKLLIYHGTLIKEKKFIFLKDLNEFLKKDIVISQWLQYESRYNECLVFINNNGYITSLEIKNQGISSLPESIGNLEKLSYLNLTGNNLKNLPESFINLKNLESINLWENKFQNIPVELSAIKSLKDQNIGIGYLYPEIFNVLKIKFELRKWSIENFLKKIENNKTFSDADLVQSNLLDFEEIIKKKCKKVKNFKALDLLKEKKVLREFESFANIYIPLNDPRSIWEKKENLGYYVENCHITYLHLTGKNLKKIPRNIGNLKYLKRLNLSHNKIEKIPNSIGELKNLKEFWINENNISFLPQEMNNLQNLEYLILSNNKFVDFPLFLDILNLKEFEIYKNPLSQDAERYLSLYYYERRKIYQNWDVNKLINRIKDNSKLNYVDKHHPDLRKFAPLIEEACIKTKTETAKQMWKVLEKECMVKLDDEGNKLWL